MQYNSTAPQTTCTKIIKQFNQQLSKTVSPTTERYHLHDMNLYTRSSPHVQLWCPFAPNETHIFTSLLLYTLHFPFPITFEVPPPTPPTCIHTPISIATPHGSINTGCELFSDELLINNKQWGSGETQLGQLGEKGKVKASSEGLETGDLQLIWSHHYHRPSDTITSAPRSPALQTAALSLTLTALHFHCLCSANIHNSLPPITSQARIGIIFCNMSIEKLFFFFRLAGIW